METEEELFHRAFNGTLGNKILYGSSRLRKKNPWTEPIGTDTDLFSFINDNKKRYPNAPTPIISIVNSTEVNAVATCFEGKYLIGLFEGALRYIWDLFGMMLCSPRILTDIGDITKEIELPPIYNAQFTDYGRYIDLNGFVDFTPKCELRKAARKYLYRMTMFSIALHEYAHIVHGHTDFKQHHKIKDSSFWEVNSKANYSPTDSLFSQTLEFDADQFAFSMGYSIIDPINFNKNKDSNYLGASLVKSSDEALRLYTFAIYTWHRIFGMYSDSKINLLSLSHPPDGIRQDSLIAIVHTITKYNSNLQEANRRAENMMKYVNEVELAFSIISEQPYNPKAFQLAHSDEYEQHHELLRYYWKHVRPCVEPFSHFDLVPVNKKYL